MCGILGFVGLNTLENRGLIHHLMIQLSLRGTHATGFAWMGQDRTISFGSEPSSYQSMPWDPTYHPEQIRMVGHTRYSTSDLEWNQPVQKNGTALVMNGVLSQETPDKWPKSKWSYGTKNDAEIALHYSLMGRRGDLHGSFAICEIDQNSLLCYRNGYRPLWYGYGATYRVCASTVDSLERCGVTNIKFLPLGSLLNLITNIDYRDVGLQPPDLQRHDWYPNLKSVV